jgi:hypothetical protein
MSRVSRKAKYASKFLLILGIVVLITTNVCLGSSKSDDIELWTTFGIVWPMHEKWKLTVDESLRFNNDVSNFYYSHTEPGIVRKDVLPDIDLGLNYRFVAGHEEDDRSNQEQRLSLNAYWKINFLTNAYHRTRLDYRDMKGKDDIWRVRNRILFNNPLEQHDLEFTVKLREFSKLYFGDEFFVNFEGEGLNRNRVIVGVQAKIHERMVLDTHYFWQMDKENGGSSWDASHILGLGIRYVF